MTGVALDTNGIRGSIFLRSAANRIRQSRQCNNPYT